MLNVIFNQNEIKNDELIRLIEDIKDIKIEDNMIKAQQKLSWVIKKLGYEVKCSFPANDRGDGKKGRINIMIYGLDKPVGICIDNKSYRKRSITKLNSVSEIYRILIVRSGNLKHLREGVHAAISLDIKGNDKKKGIYTITNLKNNKVYVGSSVNLGSRLNDHKHKLINNEHANIYLQNDWNKYGEDNFEFKIIKLVEMETDLPKEEKSLIDISKQEFGVYNISDPLEETHRGRFKKEKVKSKGSSKYSKQQVLDYMNENFSDKIQILHKHIPERKFFSKEKLDDWFRDNIKDQDIVNDINFLQFLKKWYNKNKFNIIETRIWKTAFKRLYGMNIEDYKYILVTSETLTELYETKYRVKKVQF